MFFRTVFRAFPSNGPKSHAPQASNPEHRTRKRHCALVGGRGAKVLRLPDEGRRAADKIREHVGKARHIRAVDARPEGIKKRAGRSVKPDMSAARADAEAVGLKQTLAELG